MPESKLYIGTKLIRAFPCSENDFRESKGSPTLHDNREGYQVLYPDGYRSWSPKEVFENAYREITEDERGLF